MPGYYDADRDDVSPRTQAWPQPGLNSVPQYQMSGIPAVGVVEDGGTVTFERVTRAITVMALSDGPTISFGNTGQGEYTLKNNGPVRLEIMVTSMTVDGADVTFVAELTGIKASECPDWANDTNQLFTITPP